MSSKYTPTYYEFLATSVRKNPFEKTWRAPLSEEQWEALQNMDLPFTIPREELANAQRMTVEQSLRSQNYSTAETMEMESALDNSCTSSLGDDYDLVSSSLGMSRVHPSYRCTSEETAVKKEDLVSLRNKINKVIGELNGMKEMVNGLLMVNGA